MEAARHLCSRSLSAQLVNQPHKHVNPTNFCYHSYLLSPAAAAGRVPCFRAPRLWSIFIMHLRFFTTVSLVNSKEQSDLIKSSSCRLWTSCGVTTGCQCISGQTWNNLSHSHLRPIKSLQLTQPQSACVWTEGGAGAHGEIPLITMSTEVGGWGGFGWHHYVVSVVSLCL